jgi:exodeoxyribonuclease VII large subunit
MSSLPDSSRGQMMLSLEPERRIFAVHELNAAIQSILESDFSNIFVAGEISGCKQAASGHYYLCLKDKSSQIKCVLFRNTARFARFKPQDGLAVIARGRLEVYSARGEYQLIIDSLEPQGSGALQLAFEQLKKKLSSEGLFDPARKRPLPALPRRIGVITSPSGAVIRDILHVLERRFRGLHIRLYPAQVQGENAVEQVCSGLHFFSEQGWPEVIILARGGGSVEDLWTFNEEPVARAIAASKIPVISAIGHETDFTIADFVADHRAPTPSAAAEIVIRTSESLVDQIDGARSKMLQALRYRLLLASRDLHQRGMDRAVMLMQRKIRQQAQRLDEIEQRLRASDLRLRFAQVRHRSDLASQRLVKLAEGVLWKANKRLETLTLHLTQLSPLTILERGYAIVQTTDGRIVRSASETSAGDTLRVRLHSDELSVVVSSENRT